MKKLLLIAILCCVMLSGAAFAADEKPFQLAFFSPMQLVPEEYSIKGLRLSVLYTLNKDVTGLSIAWVGVNKASGNVNGVEIGLANWVEQSAYGGQIGIINYAGQRFVGLQYGAINVVKGDCSGIQWGLVNWTDGFVHGLQCGLVNASQGDSSGIALGIVNYNEGTFKGLQVGLFNYTKSLNGVQIGLGNYNGNKKPMEFMVLVNASF